MAERPQRLERIFEKYDPPLYFVTFNTSRRRRVLANDVVFECFRDFATKGRDRDFAVGRYVLMPDHVHLFICGPRDFDLSQWIRILKRVLSRVLAVETPHWQEGFFDHLIRNSESYEEKWSYVREDPVRAGLVDSADKWPYGGEIVRIDRA